MSLDPSFVRAYRFFREQQVGYIGGSAECAYRLARAEAWAESSGLRIEWEEELEPWDGEYPLDPGTDLLCAVAYNAAGDVVGSLGMVAVRFRDPYTRVVEAELAAEYQAEVAASFAKEHAPAESIAAGW